MKGSYSIKGERAGHKPGSVLLRGQLSIWDACYQTPQAALIERNWKKTNRSSYRLAPNRGLPSQHLSILLVRSYRTFAPLPDQLKM